MLGVSVSMVYNLISKEIRFPSELEEFIFSDLRGTYKREFEKVKQTLEYDENDLRKYLGTYFPGSFSESCAIFSNLFCNELIRNNFEIKRDIYILDIGSGTGGNLLGLLWFMKKYLLDFDNKKIHIISIDGNDCALDFQGKLIEKFFPKNTNFYQENIIFSRNNFKEKLNNIIDDYKITDRFDIIMSFRFINEFYREHFLFSWDEIPGKDNERVKDYLRETNGVYWANEAKFEKNGTIISISNERSSLSLKMKDWETAILIIDGKIKDDFFLKNENDEKNIYLDKYHKNKGMYKTIIETVSDHLDEKGLFILSDVADKINDNTNLFLSKIMNKETVEYLNSWEPKLKVIMPISCAFWHSSCKSKKCFTKKEVYLRNRKCLRGFNYSYKIFTHKVLALQVLQHIDKQDCYEIGEKWICNKGVYRYKRKDGIVCRDPFSFNNGN